MSHDRISYLVRNYAANSATVEEVEELFAWIRDHSKDDVLQSELEKMAATTAPDQHYDPEYWESFISQVLSKEEQYDHAAIRRILPLRQRWFRYAAAAVLIIGIATIAFVLYSARRHSSTPDIAKSPVNDVLPGRDRAMLTLANGVTIVLDSAQGNIVQQRGLIVINSNGKLDYEGKDDLVEHHTLRTPRGGQYQLQLPDGTDVWLNAESSITYPTVFTGNTRTLSITGEVYFEVAKDKTKPFRVQVSDMEVEVLGTHFNINSYPDEALIKTTLLEGKVKVNKRGVVAAGSSVTLQPGQQAQFTTVGPVTADRSLTMVTGVDVDQVLAWKNGIFNFNKSSLQEVLRQISRWYDVEVIYRGNIHTKKFGGEIGRDLNLSEVLDGLKGTDVHFKIEGRKLIVMP